MYKESVSGNLYALYEDENGEYVKDSKRYNLYECNWVETPEGVEVDNFIDLATKDKAVEYFKLIWSPLVDNTDKVI